MEIYLIHSKIMYFNKCIINIEYFMKLFKTKIVIIWYVILNLKYCFYKMNTFEYVNISNKVGILKIL